MMEKLESIIETVLFSSRWLLAPLYVGLVGALIILLVKFSQKLYVFIPKVLEMESTELIVSILGLIDIVLVANLLLIIIFSGYENFVSKIDMVQGHVDKPEWMGKVDYTALKVKVIGSIVAISSIELLKVFIKVQEMMVQEKIVLQENIMWLVIIHIVFVVSGVLFVIMERIIHPPHPPGEHKAGNAETH